MQRIIFLFQRNWSFDQGPNPKTIRARIRRWEGPILLLAGTLKLAVIIVSIWLWCWIDHTGPLPQPDSAHYTILLWIRQQSTSDLSWDGLESTQVEPKLSLWDFAREKQESDKNTQTLTFECFKQQLANNFRTTYIFQPFCVNVLLWYLIRDD